MGWRGYRAGYSSHRPVTHDVHLPITDSVGAEKVQISSQLRSAVDALIRCFPDYIFVEQDSRAHNSVLLHISSSPDSELIVPILVRHKSGALWLDINGDYRVTGALLKLVGSNDKPDLSTRTIETITPDLELALME